MSLFETEIRVLGFQAKVAETHDMAITAFIGSAHVSKAVEAVAIIIAVYDFLNRETQCVFLNMA
jgi:hypothetical protein